MKIMTSEKKNKKSVIRSMPYQTSSLYNFISSEWYKLIRSRFFHVCVLVNAGVAALIDISVKISGDAYSTLAERLRGTEHTNATVGGIIEMVRFSEKGNPVWAAAYSFGSFGLIIGAIFVILFLNMEYKKGTMLILIGRGYSRTKLVLAKIITAILGLGVMQMVTAAAAFLTGIFIWGFPAGSISMISDMLLVFGCNMVLCIGSLAPAFVLAVLLQNSGEAIGIYMVGDFLLKNAANVGVDYHLISDKTVSAVFISGKMAKMSNILDPLPIPWTEMGISVCYAVMAALICCYLIRKKDLN